MRRVSRRGFLAAGGVALGSLPLLRLGAPSADGVFQHGVASGDPAADGMVLWTRVTTERDAVDVGWRVAHEAAMSAVVASGTVRTSHVRDNTVKVVVSGLDAGTTYYYAFEALGDRSAVGRTRTLPRAGASRVRLAVCSCANLPAGYFNAYRRIAARHDLDAVLHLGDYFYEYENGRFGDGTASGRLPMPAREVVALADYRARHAQYKTDPDLQAVHREHPFVVVWDDHDFANDTWRDGAENHNPDRGEGDWYVRRAAAMRAFFEWMPIREGIGSLTPRIYRTLPFGGLADLVMLDTRVAGRDRKVASRDDIGRLEAPDRSMLGAAQEQWLAGELAASTRAGTPWQVLGQQVMFAPQTPPGEPSVATDSWDGYRAARDRVFDIVETVRPSNFVVLTGDAHSAWAYDLARRPYDAYDATTGRGAVGVELVGTSITSPTGLGSGPDGARQIAGILDGRPHLRYLEPRYRGYLIVDMTRERLQADWFTMSTVDDRSHEERFDRAFVTEAGRPHLVETSSPAPSRADMPPPVAGV